MSTYQRVGGCQPIQAADDNIMYVQLPSRVPCYLTSMSTSSPFLRLPPELRNSVYELALGVKLQATKGKDETTPRKCFDVIDWTSVDRWADWRFPPSTQYPGILQVCRLIREETLPIFYEMNDFIFQEDELDHIMKRVTDVVIPSGGNKFLKRVTAGNDHWDGKTKCASLCVLAANGIRPALLGNSFDITSVTRHREPHAICWLGKFAYQLLKEDSKDGVTCRNASTPSHELQQATWSRLSMWLETHRLGFPYGGIISAHCPFESCPLDDSPPKPISSWKCGKPPMEFHESNRS